MSRQTCAIYSPGALRKHLQQPKIGGMQKKKKRGEKGSQQNQAQYVKKIKECRYHQNTVKKLQHHLKKQMFQVRYTKHVQPV